MAKGEEIDAWSAIGRIEVDLESLKKSLDKAHELVKENSGRIETTMGETAKKVSKHIRELAGGGEGEGGPGGLGPGGGGGEGGGRHNPTAEFAHISRIVAHTLIPALSRISPAFAEFIQVGSQAARTAVFFGAALGGAAIAASIISAVIGKYVDQAKEATAITLEASRALDTLDSARAEGGIKKIIEAVSEYNVQADIANGKIEAGFWQTLIAYSKIAAEAVTDSVDTQVKKMHELLVAQGQIKWKTDEIKAVAEAEKNLGELTGHRAQALMGEAHSAEAVTNAYDMMARSIETKAAAQKRDLQRQRDEAYAQTTKPVVDALSAKIKEAKDHRDAIIENEKKAFAVNAAARKKNADDVAADNATIIRLTQDKSQAETNFMLSQASNAEAMRKVEEDKTQNLVENTEKRIAALGKEVQERATFVDQTIASEEKIRQVRQNDLGQVESEWHLTERLNQSREAALIPLRAQLTAIEQIGEARKKQLTTDLAANQDALKRSPDNDPMHAVHKARVDELGKEISTLETSQQKETERKKNEISRTELAKRAEEEQAIAARNRAVTEREDRTAGHKVAMGRVSMAHEAARLQSAITDPRRTLDQQRKAEEDLQALKIQYASNYFKLYESLGRPRYAEELQYAKDIASEQATGSQKWFDAVQQVANKYQEIHDKAKGIFNQRAGIAEAEARRQGREEIGPGDVDTFFYAAMQRAQAKRGGAMGTGLGLSEMMNITEAGQKKQHGIGTGEAFQMAMQDPQKQFADALEQMGTTVGSSSQAMKEGAEQAGEAASGAAKALQDLTEAATAAANALGQISGSGSMTGRTEKSAGIDPLGGNDTSAAFQKRFDAASTKLAGYGILSSNEGRAYKPPWAPVDSVAAGKSGADDAKRAPAPGADQ
jgi:hypothetical protein